MANSLTFNSVDLGGANYGFIVESNTLVQMPQPRVNRDPLAQADGGVAQGSTFAAKEGVVSGIVVATSFANLKTQRANIEAALAKGQEGAKTLTFDAFSGKQWTARPVGIDWGEETPITIRLAIRFYAPNPWPVATSATTTDDQNNDGGGITNI